MVNEAATSGADSPSQNRTVGGEAALRISTLEERVQRLEKAVAGLQDTRQIEERVAENVTARVRRDQSNGIQAAVNPILDAGRRLLPVATLALKQGASAVDAQAQSSPTGPARNWLLFELYAEVRAAIRMYVDPRYRVSWQGRILPVVLVVAIFTSWIWFPGTSILPEVASDLIVKVVDLLLAFVLFEVLHREVHRYRKASPDLPPSLRL
jgi:hypothetical protein